MADSSAIDSPGHQRDLRRSEWRTLGVLGVPSLTLAFAITIVSTYLPVQLQQGKGSTTVIGLLIGGEGLLALFVPLVAGTWSDRLRTRIGGRLPFIIAGAPFMAASLLLLGLSSGVGAAALLLIVFFAAYYVAYEPYRALYPDLVGDEIAARAQSTQAVARGMGTFLALVGGGLLIALAKPAPFVAGALVTLLGTALFVWAVLRRGTPEQDEASSDSVHEDIQRIRACVVERPPLRSYLVANALWELSLGALKTFIVLYLTLGLGMSLEMSSAAIGAVALILLGGAIAGGKLADRYGIAHVMRWSIIVYGIGLFVPFVITSKLVIAAAAPLIAVGGGVLMTLPYALLMPLMDEADHGVLTGFYSFSRGVGMALGPLLAGGAISLGSGLFTATKGYQAMWGVCAIAVLVSLVPLSRLRDEVDEETG